MSTTLQLAAPASTVGTRYCGKHPQERVVGVCSACLASKLSSLIYTSTAFAPEDLDNFRVRPSPLSNSPPVSICSPTNHHHPHQDHLQTVNEEADSTTQEINNEGLLRSTSEAPFTAVEVCAGTELVGDNFVLSNIIKEQISLIYDVVPPIEEENPITNQDISLISEAASVINEEVRINNLEEGKSKANPYLRANKPIKCKRSKSLNGLRGESIIKLEKEAHEYESAANTKGEQSNTGAKKVTLRKLFQLDDEDNPIEEECDSDSKKIEEANDVLDNHTHNSHRCVPSASTFSSSVCPSMPCKFKHSVLLNSLLCRKTGNEKKGSGSIRKPSQVHEGSRTIFIRGGNEGGLAQARHEGGFIRATYIASESREGLRRCRSKFERSVARSSVSSQPASPPCVSHGVDMKSERKFNLTARALAAEFPSILCSSAETAEAMVMIPSKIEDSSNGVTQIEDSKEGPDLRLFTNNDSIAVAADVPATLQSPKVDAKPVIQLVSTEEEHDWAYSIPIAAEETESGKATENGSFSGNRKDQDDEEVEQAEMPVRKHIILGTPTVMNIPSNAQLRAADTTVTIPISKRTNLEDVHEDRSRADADQEEAVESRNGIPTYITATESVTESQEVPMAVCCRSLSYSGSSGKTIAAAAGQQNTQKVPEECKNGGVWEAYSNKSGKGGRKWPSSTSRTVKIAPDQSGLLRFYLTPLARPRCSSTRRPPTKRHFWSLVFI